MLHDILQIPKVLKVDKRKNIIVIYYKEGSRYRGIIKRQEQELYNLGLQSSLKTLEEKIEEVITRRGYE